MTVLIAAAEMATIVIEPEHLVRMLGSCCYRNVASVIQTIGMVALFEIRR